MTNKVRFIMLFVAGMATVAFNSCSKESEGKDDERKIPAIQVKNQNDLTQTFYADAGRSRGISITTTGAWTSAIKTPATSSSRRSRALEAPPGWITISPDRGDKAGDYTIFISLEINTTGVDRTALIIISSGGASITITVKQKGVTVNGDIPDTPDPLTYDKGVIIDGIKWATRNVDKPGAFAATPEAPGMFYQWNSKEGWSYNDPLTPSDGTGTWNYSWNGNNATAWEKVNDPCPAGWRMPSQDELNSLYAAGSIWTTVKNMNGGRFGSGSGTVFLPAAGYRYNNVGMLYSAGSGGYYWSSTRHDNEGAYYLGFRSGVTYQNYSWNEAYGLSCRCVEE